MTSWTAINSNVLDANANAQRETQEAYVAKTTKLYEQALRMQHKGQESEARQLYHHLLSHDREHSIGANLIYLCNKNLATLEVKQNNLTRALRLFSNALEIDTTDVTLWYQMGNCAKRCGELWLARRLYEEGAKGDLTFWPILENLCKVLHVIGDHTEYKMLASYIINAGYYCPAIHAINEEADCLQFTNSFLPENPKKRKLLHEKHARNVMQELQDISATRRRTYAASCTPMLKDSSSCDTNPISYELENINWRDIGLVLLRAFEETVISASDRAHLIRKVKLFWRKQAKTESPVPLTRLQTHLSVDKQRSTYKVHDELQGLNQKKIQTITGRRISQRHKDKKLEEQQAAVKIAQDNDIAYQLECLLSVSSQQDESLALKEKFRSDDSMRQFQTMLIENLNTRGIDLQIENADQRMHLSARLSVLADTNCDNEDKRERVLDCPCFRAPALQSTIDNWGYNLPDKQSIHYRDTELGEMTQVLGNKLLSRADIDRFLLELGHVCKDSNDTCFMEVDISRALLHYLTTSSKWAFMQLMNENDNAGISVQTICLWIHKIVTRNSARFAHYMNDITGKMSPVKLAGSFVVQFKKGAADSSSLPVHVQLFVLELAVDQLRSTISKWKQSVIQKASKLRKEIRKRWQVEITRFVELAQALLLDLCVSDDGHSDKEVAEDFTIFARLFWVLGNLYEASSCWEETINSYAKCLEMIQKSAFASHCESEYFIALSNCTNDPILSTKVIQNRLGSLEYVTRSSEAIVWYKKGQFDQVIERIFPFFFPVGKNAHENLILYDSHNTEKKHQKPECKDGFEADTRIKLLQVFWISCQKGKKWCFQDCRNQLWMLGTLLFQITRKLLGQVQRVNFDDQTFDPFAEDTNILEWILTVLVKILLQAADNECVVDESLQKIFAIIVLCVVAVTDPCILIFASSPVCILKCITRLLILMASLEREILQSVFKLFGWEIKGDLQAESSVICIIGPLIHFVKKLLNFDNRNGVFVKKFGLSIPKSCNIHEKLQLILVTALQILNEIVVRCLGTDAKSAEHTLMDCMSQKMRKDILLDCCAILRSGNHKLQNSQYQSEDERIVKLYHNAATTFLVLHWIQTLSAAQVTENSIQTIECFIKATTLLHQSLAQHNICSGKVPGKALSQIYENSAHAIEINFVQIAVLMMEKLQRKLQMNWKIAYSQPRMTNAKYETLYKSMEKLLAQCFRCLYNVQLLHGLEDHNTGHELLGSLNSEDRNRSENKQLLDFSAVLRIANIGFPLLLQHPTKTTTQKKDHGKLLTLVKTAIAAIASNPMINLSTITHKCPKMDHIFRVTLETSIIHGSVALQNPIFSQFFTMTLFSFTEKSIFSPDAIWKQARLTAQEIHCNIDKKYTENNNFLDHLWYLLGENETAPRRNRGGGTDLRELSLIEGKIKRKLSFCLVDVLHFHSERLESYVHIANAARDLYFATTDAAIVIFGRSKMYQIWSQVLERSHSVRSLLSLMDFEEKVLQINIFMSLVAWRDGNNKTQVLNPSPSSDTQNHMTQCDIENQIGLYCFLLSEFALRCYNIAAALAECNAKADEAKDEPAYKLQLECFEEAGLLLHAIVQDIAPSRNSKLTQCQICALSDANITYEKESNVESHLTYIEQALWYFKQGLGKMCLRSNTFGNLDKNAERDGFSYEFRFRYNYMAGKLSKLLWKEYTYLRNANEDFAMGALTESILRYWSTAEQARLQGRLEQHGYGLLHAFYALHTFRFQVLLQYPDTLSLLRRVGKYAFVRASTKDNESREEFLALQTNAANRDVKMSADCLRNKPLSTLSKGNLKNLAIIDTHDSKILAKYRALMYLNILDALEDVISQERYFHSAQYYAAIVYHSVSQFTKSKSNSQSSALTTSDLTYFLDFIVNRKKKSCKSQKLSLITATPNGTAQTEYIQLHCAIESMSALFDKKRPQIVAIWFTEYVSSVKKFEQLNQRQAKYDQYRLRYWNFYLHLLETMDAYGRLKEITLWTMACKEEHDVVRIMLFQVLQARANVLEMRIKRLIDNTNSEIETKHKSLSKIYGFYSDVCTCIDRLTCINMRQIIMQRAENLLLTGFGLVNKDDRPLSMRNAQEYCENQWPERAKMAKVLKCPVNAEDST